MTTAQKTVGIIGTGVIGAGWATRALARGWDVVAWDPGDGAASRLTDSIERAWPSAIKLGLFPGADPTRVVFCDTPEHVAEQADHIQESAPENEDIKRPLLQRLAAASGPEVVIASSSSGLLPSRLQADCAHPERILIGHPFNPVYLLPLVELVAGDQTSATAMETARQHYDDQVMYPLVVRKEIEGYLSDRLQEALWREILHLVNDGVATTKELDDAIIYGPGLRWAGMGTNLTFHLAGGEQGMRHMLRQFGPALKLPWTKLVAPELTDELIESMADGCLDQADGRSIAELERLRDDYVIATMRSLRPLDLGAGRLIAEREVRIGAAQAITDSWSPEATITAPLDLHSTRVEADWLDDNGHMTEAAFLTAFGGASDRFYRHIGIDDAYRAAGHSLARVETHTNYLGDVSVGDPLRITTQILAVDANKIHVFHAAHHGDTNVLVSTSEQLLRHVETKTQAATPILGGPRAALAAIAAAHADLPTPDQIGRQIQIG